MPLAPVQLLWLNLVTDSLPALALGVEPVEPGVMDQPPRDARAGLFDGKFTLRLLWQGLMVGVLTLAAYFLGFTRLAAPGSEGPVANTMAFATLTLCQLFHAFNVRSDSFDIFKDLKLNPGFMRVFVIIVLVQAFIVNAALIPEPVFGWISNMFSCVPFPPAGWAAAILLAFTMIPVDILRKVIVGRK